ncbi:SseB family protein [Propionicicella superfundia]|uniref:SseB family protein n=1 Tax=Propionicicella superfundia TaxID=348582 RepID=UPI0003F640AF|nr:SseB family protein [Propionicicella superfundia]
MLLKDSGEADPEVRRAIADAVADGGVDAYLRAVAHLCLARLYLPFIDSREPGARRPDLGTVSLETGGVRRLLAFTGRDAVQAWRSHAWPHPATLDELAATAVEAGAAELLVDVSGPVPFVVGEEILSELAQGRRLVALADGFGWARLAPGDP